MKERDAKLVENAIKALEAIKKSTWTTDSILAKMNETTLDLCLNDLNKISK